LPAASGAEVAGLQVHHNKAPQLEMIEEQIEVEILVTDFQMHMTADQGEAGTEFEEEFFDVLQQAQLDSTLVGVVAQI
jgi:hypothetical protein